MCFFSRCPAAHKHGSRGGSPQHWPEHEGSAQSGFRSSVIMAFLSREPSQLVSFVLSQLPQLRQQLRQLNSRSSILSIRVGSAPPLSRSLSYAYVIVKAARFATSCLHPRKCLERYPSPSPRLAVGQALPGFTRLHFVAFCTFCKTFPGH